MWLERRSAAGDFNAGTEDLPRQIIELSRPRLDDSIGFKKAWSERPMALSISRYTYPRRFRILLVCGHA